MTPAAPPASSHAAVTPGHCRRGIEADPCGGRRHGWHTRHHSTLSVDAMHAPTNRRHTAPMHRGTPDPRTTRLNTPASSTHTASDPPSLRALTNSATDSAPMSNRVGTGVRTTRPDDGKSRQESVQRPPALAPLTVPPRTAPGQHPVVSWGAGGPLCETPGGRGDALAGTNNALIALSDAHGRHRRRHVPSRRSSRGWGRAPKPEIPARAAQETPQIAGWTTNSNSGGLQGGSASEGSARWAA